MITERTRQEIERLLAAGEPAAALALCDQLCASEPGDTEAWLLKGVALTRLQRYTEAEASLTTARALDTDAPEVEYRLGRVNQLQGHWPRAVDYYRRAIAADPAMIEAILGLSQAYAALGEDGQAAAVCRDGLAQRPGEPRLLVRLGVLARERRQFDEAIDLFRQALATDPRCLPALLQLGACYRHRARPDLARIQYQQALEIAPDRADIMNNLAGVLVGLGQDQGARTLLEQAIDLAPGQAEYLHNLARVYRQQGEVEAATDLYRRIAALNPRDPAPHFALASLARSLGRDDDAVAAYRRALSLAPKDAWGRNELANLYRDRGQLDEAIAHYRQAIACDHTIAALHVNLGNALRDRGEVTAAIASYREALRLDPEDAGTYNNLANILKDVGAHEEAFAAYRRALANQPTEPEVISNWLMALNYDLSHSQPEICQEHVTWMARLYGSVKADGGVIETRADPHRPLRIGYVSPDLRLHSVAYFFEPLLRGHRAEQVESYCYADVKRSDAMTARLRTLSGHWRDIVHRTDEEVVEMVRADRIDILVDLAGHTAGNRLGVFARRPAPIQVSWLGYPNTTGLSTMDYRLTDQDADPPPEADRWHTERLIRLPHGFICYLPPADAPAIESLPMAHAGAVTFGSFNNLAKVTEATIALWAQLLKSVPGSRLLMKSRAYADVGVCARMDARFAAHGIGSERLELLAWSDSHRAHLELYRRVDLALDTFPYHGTTTTCEALWMGVPVITQAGDRHASRVGVSILRRVGLEALVAADGHDYLARAVALVTDPERLRTLREGLRPRMQGSPLCDGPGFVREVERSYRRLWVDRCRLSDPAKADPDGEDPTGGGSVGDAWS